MYDAQRNILQDGRVHRFDIYGEGGVLTYAAALEQWQEDASFRSFFIELLREVPFSAYRWETPPVTSASQDRPFEFAVVDDPALGHPPDPSPFAPHFAEADADPGIAVFDNLGGDAKLVAPCPQGPESAYGHLAAFVREGPASQNHALWQAVAAAVVRRIGERPLWLSTAGGGVAWLHVRLDTRPKYYRYRPYAQLA